MTGPHPTSTTVVDWGSLLHPMWFLTLINESRHALLVSAPTSNYLLGFSQDATCHCYAFSCLFLFSSPSRHTSCYIFSKGLKSPSKWGREITDGVRCIRRHQSCESKRSIHATALWPGPLFGALCGPWISEPGPSDLLPHLKQLIPFQLETHT